MDPVWRRTAGNLDVFRGLSQTVYILLGRSDSTMVLVYILGRLMLFSNCISHISLSQETEFSFSLPCWGLRQC